MSENMSSFNDEREGTGTKEWSDISYNIQLGCQNNCLYCYAKANAIRFGRIKSHNEWANETIREKAVNKNWNKRDGVIMFPTTHDITEQNIEAVIITLGKMLKTGNNVLIVSKPRLSCMRRICAEFSDHKEQIMFRFTIGSLDEKVCNFWEPGAPTPTERLQALKHARYEGFQTSVSMEPMLGGRCGVNWMVQMLSPFVTDTIWIGKMNKPRQRVDISNPRNLKVVEAIEILQTDEVILELVNELKDNSKVRWKDSIKKVIENSGLR
jgi:DNA repair photolyase